MNFAWAIEFHGFVIDDDGRIWSYDRAPSHTTLDAWWNPKPAANEPGHFDGADLRGKYWLAESHLQVPLATVEHAALLIWPARVGKLSSQFPAFDSGAHGCVAYLWNDDKTVYESVMLHSNGDLTVRNSAPEAHELSKWLLGIGRALPDL